MKKCYFSLNYATIWCERCWENLKCYLAPQLWKLVPIPNNTLHLAKNASHMTIPVHPCFVTALCYEYNGFFSKVQILWEDFKVGKKLLPFFINKLSMICLKWFVFTKTVLTYCEKTFSSFLKLLKFEAGDREFSKSLRSLEQFVQTVKGRDNFWQQNAF